MQEVKVHDSILYKKELINLYSRIAKVLDDANIEFFGVFGTCLGAVREGGIIPWDDDIDLAVRRDDYEKTLKILSRSSEQIFCLRSDFRFGRIFNRVKKDDSIEKKRAYIDLYVIDKVQESKLLYRWSVLWYVGISRIISRRAKCLGRKHPFLYFIADFVTFPFRLLNNSMLYYLAERSYVYKGNSSLVKLSFDANRKRYPADLFEKAIRVSFNGVQMRIPSQYDKYLKLCYGDWRVPPPVSERVGHAINREGVVWTVNIPSDFEREEI